MHFSNFTMITQRVSLSIAIIAMVNSTQQHGQSNASSEGPLADSLSNPGSSIEEFHTRVSITENSLLRGKTQFERCAWALILWNREAWLSNDKLQRTGTTFLWDIAYLCDKIIFHWNYYDYKVEELLDKIVKTSKKEQIIGCLQGKIRHILLPYSMPVSTFHCLGVIFQLCKFYTANSNPNDFCA